MSPEIDFGAGSQRSGPFPKSDALSRQIRAMHSGERFWVGGEDHLPNALPLQWVGSFTGMLGRIYALTPQNGGVVADVVFNKGGNEIVSVVVAGVHPQVERLAHLLASLFK